MSIWDRFDDIASAEEVETAKKKFEPIEIGRYQTILEELKPDENRDGLPMLKGKFKCVDGGRVIFYNQNLQNLNYPNLTASNIADATVFVGALLGEEIAFKGLADLAKRVEEVEIGKEFTIEVSYGKKDTDRKYPKLKVIPAEDIPTDESMPFDA